MWRRKARSFLRSGTSLREHGSFSEWKEYCRRELSRAQNETSISHRLPKHGFTL